MVNLKLKGSIGELAVAQNLMQQGYPVFTELGDTSKVDLITLIDNKPVRIQVKSSEEKNGIVSFTKFKAYKNTGYIYNSNDCDVFALYNHTKNIVCYIGWSELRELNTLYVRFAPPKDGRYDRVRMYSDFLSIHDAVSSTNNFIATRAS